MLLLPGLVCDAEVWASQQAALGGGREVVVAHWGALDSIARMARHLLDTVAAPRFALAGHSMGGRVALEVVRQAPERVLGLALLDSGTAPLAAGAPGEAERQGRQALVALAQRDGMEAMARQWAPPMVHPAVVGSALFERVVAMVARHPAHIFQAQIQALLNRPDGAPVLQQLQCPLLLLCGRQDGWSPPERHQAMQALVPGAVLTLVDDCGHMSPMEQPQAVTSALARWLEQCDGRA
ncbi:MAG: alpha/beta hydrolase [Aquabacterium sp.]|nr:alpha/beta hydrolase [Aquabacterium sp.]